MNYHNHYYCTTLPVISRFCAPSQGASPLRSPPSPFRGLKVQGLGFRVQGNPVVETVVKSCHLKHIER